MLKVDMQIQGLDELRRRIGNTQTLDAELRRAESESLDIVKERARSNASAFSAVLPNSIQTKIEAKGLSGIVGSVAKTALSIEQGRRPGQMPSFESIERWMARKGIATGSAQRVATHRRVRFRRGSANASQLHDDAVEIAFKIRDSGTKSLPYLVPAAQSEKDRVKQSFSAAISRAVKKWAGR